jgi:hypothetical protein
MGILERLWSLESGRCIYSYLLHLNLMSIRDLVGTSRVIIGQGCSN